MLIALLCLALGIGASSAHAAPLRTAITVRPGASCVTAESLLPQIEAWLASSEVEPGWSVDVVGDTFDPRVIGYALREQGALRAQRTFEPGPALCAQLEATLALAIALALKASLLEELSAIEPAPTRLSLIASASSLLGFAPKAPLGPQLAFGAGLGARVSLRAGLTFWASGNNDLRVGRFDLRVLALRVDGCVLTFRSISGSLHACAGARFGAAWARAEQLAVNTSAHEPWFALAASAIFLLPITRRWSFELATGWLVSAVRPSFVVLQSAQRVEDYTVPRFAAELSAGPRLSF